MIANVLIHFYEFAELYTVLLAWIVIPLFFFTVFLFFSRHYGLFTPFTSEDLNTPHPADHRVETGERVQHGTP